MESNHNHFIIKCNKCQNVISQCRCASKEKTVAYDTCIHCLNMKTNPCTCQRHPDAAFTVKVVNGVAHCLRCGGAIVRRDEDGK